jgi:hypothetical protein
MAAWKVLSVVSGAGLAATETSPRVSFGKTLLVGSGIDPRAVDDLVTSGSVVAAALAQA